MDGKPIHTVYKAIAPKPMKGDTISFRKPQEDIPTEFLNIVWEYFYIGDGFKEIHLRKKI